MWYGANTSKKSYAGVAQSAERRIRNAQVGSSILPSGSNGVNAQEISVSWFFKETSQRMLACLCSES